MAQTSRSAALQVREAASITPPHPDGSLAADTDAAAAKMLFQVKDQDSAPSKTEQQQQKEDQQPTSTPTDPTKVTEQPPEDGRAQSAGDPDQVGICFNRTRC